MSEDKEETQKSGEDTVAITTYDDLNDLAGSQDIRTLLILVLISFGTCDSEFQIFVFLSFILQCLVSFVLFFIFCLLLYLCMYT